MDHKRFWLNLGAFICALCILNSQVVFASQQPPDSKSSHVVNSKEICEELLEKPGKKANEKRSGTSQAATIQGVSQPLEKNQSKNKSPREAWADSIQALKQISQTIYGRSEAIEALTTAILAKEFVWINGEPGGAKTFLSRLMFESVLNSISEKEKKIFILQFHKLISEGKISGFQKFSSMLKDGKYEIETESSLVGDKFLFLIADEAEKSNPAVLNALLSVLNERKAFLGSRVVDAILSSGVFTSNKTTGEFIQGFLNDRASGEALLDRMAIKIHMSNQQLNAKETVAMYDLVKNPNKLKITLPLRDLEGLIAKVKIPDDMMAEIVSIVREFDRYVTAKTDKSRYDVRYGEKTSEDFPANQFSNRSVRRLVQIFKAALISKQLMDGVAFDQVRLTPKKEDLSLLSQSAVYVGPSSIRLKRYSVTEFKDGKIINFGVKVRSSFGTVTELAVQYSPYENELRLQDGNGKTHFVYILKNNDWVLKSQSSDFADWSVEEKGLNDLNARIKEVEAQNNIDLTKPQFEVDENIYVLLKKKTLKEGTRRELESIKKDAEQFVNVLNQHFSGAAQISSTQNTQPAIGSSQNQAKSIAQEKWLPKRSEKEKRELRRDTLSATQEERTYRYYEWMSYEVKAMKQRFVELDYSIEAHLTGLLSENHLYVFGPPGGAKTALAEVILKAELKKLNADQVDKFVKSILPVVTKDKTFARAALSQLQKENLKQFDRFLLQFHKLLPEGILIGFPKTEKQLNEGIEEIEVSTSLASQRFIFAILDEVDKANPQTITALLSILNEREVFAGNQVIKTALKTAVLTSNKMPSEFLDSYYEDRSTGEAVMDRAIDKVFVSNKISSEEALTQFLINLEKGISPNWEGLLAVHELLPLVNQVTFESPALKEILAQVHEKFLESRIKVEEETKRAHDMDPREFPYYYVAAGGSASDRSFIKYLDQLKSRFIVHQLMNGVAFKDLKTKMQMKDLGLFFEGMAYWGPQKIEYSTDSRPSDQNGKVHFTPNSAILQLLIASGVVDARVKYHLEMMSDEAKDFCGVLNKAVDEFMDGYKKEITKYPDLFPGISYQTSPTAMTSQKKGTSPNETSQKGTNPAQISREEINSEIHDLSRLRLDLDLAKSEGKNLAQITALKSDYKKKERNLSEYLEKNHVMTRDELIKQMKKEIALLQSENQVDRQKENKVNEEEAKRRKEQEKEIRESVIDGSRAVFQTVEPGPFKMGEGNNIVDAEISKPFDIMASHVTQIIYKKVAETAKKRFPAKYKDLDPDPSKFKGDRRPVEKVSYDDTQVWLESLHDLINANDPVIAEVFPGHKAGCQYDLLTEAQAEFAMQKAVTEDGDTINAMIARGDTAKLSEYAYSNENSQNLTDKTRDVGLNKPLFVDGKPVFDLNGHVWIWVKDAWGDKLRGGRDPFVQGAPGANRVSRGGSWGNGARDLRSGYRLIWWPVYRHNDVGFRLSRTCQ